MKEIDTDDTDDTSELPSLVGDEAISGRLVELITFEK